MGIVIFSIVLSVGLYSAIVFLMERYRMVFKHWGDVLEDVEAEAVRAIQQLPVEYEGDEAWGRQSRAFSKEFAAVLESALASDGRPKDTAAIAEEADGNDHPPPEALSERAQADDEADTSSVQSSAGGGVPEAERGDRGNGHPSPRLAIGAEDPAVSYLRDRLSLLGRLVAAHYPFPSAIGQVDESMAHPWPARIAWPVFAAVPLLLTLGAATAAVGTRLATSTTLAWIVGGATLGYVLMSIAAWWRREGLQHQVDRVYQSVKRLEQYAAVPFQDRVQMDMSISLMESMSDHSANLNQALQKHTKAVDAIPASIAGEVSTQVESGLGPIRSEIEMLRERLTSSYDAMSGALTETATRLVTLIDRIGVIDKYETWSSYLAESSQSTQSLANALSKYQAQTEGFYSDLVSLASELSESQAKVEKAYTEIAASVAERALHEELARSELKDTVREQMELLLKEQSQFNATLNEMTARVRESQKLYRSIEDHLPPLINSVSDVTTRLHETAHAVSSLPAVYKEALTKLHDQSERYTDRLAEGLKSMEGEHQAYLEGIGQHTEKFVQSLNRSSDQLANQLQRHLEDMRSHRKELEDSREALDNLHGQALREMSSEVDRYVESMRSYQDEVEAHRQAFAEACQSLVKGVGDEVNRFMEGLQEYAAQIKKPEHWLVKPALFTLLSGILICLVILISRIS
jgi:ABC-type transporter Mla subunit MlaD